MPPISKTFSNAVDDADAFETAHVSKHLSPLLGSALERELWLSVGSHGTPSGLDLWLAVVTNALWLPWLIEGLEVESVVAPVDRGAEAVAAMH